jgi:hypothetical protein
MFTVFINEKIPLKTNIPLFHVGGNIQNTMKINIISNINKFMRRKLLNGIHSQKNE